VEADGVLVVELYLSSNQSLGDLLCAQGLAMRPSMTELCRTPDGHSGSSDNEQPYYAPVSCVDLPQRQVVVAGGGDDGGVSSSSSSCSSSSILLICTPCSLNKYVYGLHMQREGLLANCATQQVTLHYIIVINVFKEKTSVTLQELNAIEQKSFQSTSENR